MGNRTPHAPKLFTLAGLYPSCRATHYSAILPSTQEPQNPFARIGNASIGASKHQYHSRLLRYSVGSLPVAPPRPPPLCCEVGNRTRHRAKCSICGTSIIQRGATCLRLSFCCPLQTYSQSYSIGEVMLLSFLSPLLSELTQLSAQLIVLPQNLG